jgi:predicted nucleic acid-binding protein
VILPDVNVLVYAHGRDAMHHERCRAWLSEVIFAVGPYAVSELDGLRWRHPLA